MYDDSNDPLIKRAAREADAETEAWRAQKRHESAQFRARNPVSVKRSQEKWKAANPGYHRQYDRQRYAANPEKYRGRRRAYYAKNKDRINARRRAARESASRQE